MIYQNRLCPFFEAAIRGENMDIIDYLPQKMRSEAKAYMPRGLEEIRVRVGKPVQYRFA